MTSNCINIAVLNAQQIAMKLKIREKIHASISMEQNFQHNQQLLKTKQRQHV